MQLSSRAHMRTHWVLAAATMTSAQQKRHAPAMVYSPFGNARFGKR
jgi:hypothetical protein